MEQRAGSKSRVGWSAREPHTLWTPWIMGLQLDSPFGHVAREPRRGRGGRDAGREQEGRSEGQREGRKKGGVVLTSVTWLCPLLGQPW